MTRFTRGRSAWLPAGACARVVAALALTAAVSAPAIAQDVPPDASGQPPGALDLPVFGSAAEPLAPPDAPPSDDAVRPPVVAKIAPRRLNLGLSLFDAYDMTTVTDTQPGLLVDPRLRQDTSFTGVNANLSFSDTGHEKAFSAAAGTDLRYYSILPSVLPVDYFGGLNFSSALSRHVSVRVGGTASYSPFYAFGNFLTPTDPTGIATPQPEQDIAALNTFTGSGSGSLTWSPTRHTSFDTIYSADYTTTPNVAYRLHSESIGGTLRHKFTRYSEFRAGYAYRTSGSGLTSVPAFVAHDIDVGFGYHRPLSFSRRTIVGFNVGTTVVALQGAKLVFVTGDGSLSYQLNRTWMISAYAHRDVSTIAGISIPFASTVGGGSLAGLWSRHVGFSVNGSYARGSSASAVANGYQAITGSSRLSFQLSRYLPAYVEYVYYRYEFQQPFGLAPGFPLLVDRSGVRFGLSYSIPLIGRRVPQP